MNENNLETLTDGHKHGVLSEPLSVYKGLCGLDEKLMPVGANIAKVVYGVNIAKGFIDGFVHSQMNRPYSPGAGIDDYDIALALTAALPATTGAYKGLEDHSPNEHMVALGGATIVGTVSAATALLANKIAYTAGYFSKPAIELAEAIFNK